MLIDVLFIIVKNFNCFKSLLVRDLFLYVTIDLDFGG